MCTKEVRDTILDSRALVDAIRDSPAWLDIAPCLYFDLLVRHALHRCGLDDRGLSDYAASVLVEFSRYGRPGAFTIDPAGSMP